MKKNIFLLLIFVITLYNCSVGKSSLFNAIINNKYEKVEKIISKDKSIINIVDNKKNWSALMYASWYGREKIAKLLIENGAEINFQDKKKKITPLMNAAYSGSEIIASLLLENGANVNAKDINKNTPLIYTAIKDSYKVAVLLLKNGADYKVINKNNENTFQIAKKFNSIKVQNLLKDKF